MSFISTPVASKHLDLVCAGWCPISTTIYHNRVSHCYASFRFWGKNLNIGHGFLDKHSTSLLVYLIILSETKFAIIFKQEPYLFGRRSCLELTGWTRIGCLSQTLRFIHTILWSRELPGFCTFLPFSVLSCNRMKSVRSGSDETIGYRCKKSKFHPKLKCCPCMCHTVLSITSDNSTRTKFHPTSSLIALIVESGALK